VKGYLDKLPSSRSASSSRVCLRICVGGQGRARRDPHRAEALRRDRGEAEGADRRIRQDFRVRRGRNQGTERSGMPSLKDLRNRIASVKATQKITKAMQMVAAAKLRRAQEAAEAARPYAQRMGAVLANLAADAGRWRRCAEADGRNGQGRRTCWSSARPSAACAAASTRRSRKARARACAQASRRRQDGQDHHRRQEGLRHPSPRSRQPRHRPRRSARRQAARLFGRGRDRQEGDRAVRKGRVRRLHAVLFGVQVGDLADPDRAAADPGHGRRRSEDAGGGDAATNTSRMRRTILDDLIPRNISVQIFRRCSRMRPPSRARA
jgi:F-type H+-transporting ATPase subunit gamma